MERDIGKIRTAVLMGGWSAEREVSLNTGTAVLEALRDAGCDAVGIDAGRDLAKMLLQEKAEVAFIALHGGVGENGSVQGLLEVLGLPYTGSGVLASALAMDKESSKKIFEHEGLTVPKWLVLRPKEKLDIASIGYPMVVKPAIEGSSVGVSIVRGAEQLDEALNQAFRYSERVIVEEYIKGKEVQIGVLGDKAVGGVEVRPKKEFYDYEAKYSGGLTEYLLPPELDEEAYALASDMALKAHKALGCKGATRVDLIVGKAPYLLEVNTIPGMTRTSLLPKIAAHAGMDFTALVMEILKEALYASQK